MITVVISLTVTAIFEAILYLAGKYFGLTNELMWFISVIVPVIWLAAAYHDVHRSMTYWAEKYRDYEHNVTKHFNKIEEKDKAQKAKIAELESRIFYLTNGDNK